VFPYLQRGKTEEDKKGANMRRLEDVENETAPEEIPDEENHDARDRVTPAIDEDLLGTVNAALHESED
jgi:hypothetical protein